MTEWPEYAVRALKRLDYPPKAHAALLKQFTERWDGVDPDALVRAVREASDDDRKLAMRMLVDAAAVEGVPALRAVLNSPVRHERWCAAHYLGELRDPNVLPILGELLFEGLPAPEDYPAACIAPDTCDIEVIRAFLPEFLGASGDTSFAPTLRRALAAAVGLEVGMGPEPRGDQAGPSDPRAEGWNMADWVVTRYQLACVFALGRLRALGSLAGLALGDLPDGDERLGLWRTHQAMGALHGRLPTKGVMDWDDVLVLRNAVSGVLERRFGMDVDEREAALALYERRMLFDTTERYASAMHSRGDSGPRSPRILAGS